MPTGYTPVNYRHAKEHNRLDELLRELDILAEKDLVINKPKRFKTDFNAGYITLPWEPPSYSRHSTGLTPPPTFQEEEDPFLSDIQFKDTPTISKLNYKQNIPDSFIQFGTPQVQPQGINHSTNIQPHQFQQTTTAICSCYRPSFYCLAYLSHSTTNIDIAANCGTIINNDSNNVANHTNNINACNFFR